LTADSFVTVGTRKLWSQDHLYQNLVGKDSIVGRSLIVFFGTDDTIFEDGANFDD